MSAAQIEAIFPDLKETGYRITSPATPRYNCFAWAGNDIRRWWQPVGLHGFYWPEAVPAVLNFENLVAIYKGLGYGLSETPDLEPGLEKLAIYVDTDGAPTHAARQLSSGQWTSKLGDLEDIEHNTLESLETYYGKVRQFLKRPRKSE